MKGSSSGILPVNTHAEVNKLNLNYIDSFIFYSSTASLHKLAAAHLQAPERQVGYCTPMKTVAYNKFNNNTWLQGVVGHSC